MLEKKIKKAILTGGGRAMRLRPITSTINKHLIPLANKPMIFYAIEKVVKAGVEEIFINLNPGDTDLPKYIGDGGHWGIEINYFEQEGGPQGVAHVVKQAEKFIGDDPFVFFLSDNLLLGDIESMIKEFTENKYDCLLALSEVADAKSFGVPIFDQNKKLIDVWEKPENPPNNFAVTGVYIYGPKVFFKAFENIQKSDRGEYEISSIHSYLLKNNYKVGYKEITGWWKDTGQPHDLVIGNSLLMSKKLENKNCNNFTQLEPNTKIEGLVQIGTGTIIKNNVNIKGPVIIGENCVLENCTILPFTTINSGCFIRQATIEESIIFSGVKIDADIHLAQSIIGERVEIIKKSPDLKKRFILGDKTLIEI